jgi:hypothetical protein
MHPMNIKLSLTPLVSRLETYFCELRLCSSCSRLYSSLLEIPVLDKECRDDRDSCSGYDDQEGIVDSSDIRSDDDPLEGLW